MTFVLDAEAIIGHGGQMGCRMANIFIGITYSFDEIAKSHGFSFVDGPQGVIEPRRPSVMRRLITEILERLVRKFSLHRHVSYRNPGSLKALAWIPMAR